MINKMLSSIGHGIIFVLKSVFIFLDSIKIVVLIPLLSVASVIFSLVVIILIQPIITNLPGFLSDGFIQSILAAIIFVILIIMIFNERMNRNLSFNYKEYLIALFGSALFWSIPLFFMNRQAEFLGEFYSSEYLDFMSIFDSVTTFLYLSFVTPHFWIATITKEFVYSVIAGLIINVSIIIIITLRNVRDLGSDFDEDFNKIKS
jgi:hypothetical protein